MSHARLNVEAGTYVQGTCKWLTNDEICGLGDVVTVFLTDLNDFFYFDQVWKEFFPSPPRRTTVQISDLAVPGCRVEIDLTADKA